MSVVYPTAIGGQAAILAEVNSIHLMRLPIFFLSERVANVTRPVDLYDIRGFSYIIGTLDQCISYCTHG